MSKNGSSGNKGAGSQGSGGPKSGGKGHASGSSGGGKGAANGGNWPSTSPGQASGPGRGNAPPSK